MKKVGEECNLSHQKAPKRTVPTSGQNSQKD